MPDQLPQNTDQRKALQEIKSSFENPSTQNSNHSTKDENERLGGFLVDEEEMPSNNNTNTGSGGGGGSKMSQSDASRIQSAQATGGKDMSSAGFASRAQSAGDRNANAFGANRGGFLGEMFGGGSGSANAGGKSGKK